MLLQVAEHDFVLRKESMTYMPEILADVVVI
jgi:hypothetical protein